MFNTAAVASVQKAKVRSCLSHLDFQSEVWNIKVKMRTGCWKELGKGTREKLKWTWDGNGPPSSLPVFSLRPIINHHFLPTAPSPTTNGPRNHFI